MDTRHGVISVSRRINELGIPHDAAQRRKELGDTF